jgi:hypothetical protein
VTRERERETNPVEEPTLRDLSLVSGVVVVVDGKGKQAKHAVPIADSGIDVPTPRPATIQTTNNPWAG